MPRNIQGVSQSFPCNIPLEGSTWNVRNLSMNCQRFSKILQNINSSKKNSPQKDSTIMYLKYNTVPGTMLPQLFFSLAFVWLNGCASCRGSWVSIQDNLPALKQVRWIKCRVLIPLQGLHHPAHLYHEVRHALQWLLCRPALLPIFSHASATLCFLKVSKTKQK